MRFPNPKPAVLLVWRALGNALSSEKGLVSEQAVEGLCALTRSAETQKEPPVQVPATDSWDSPNIDSRFLFSCYAVHLRHAYCGRCSF